MDKTNESSESPKKCFCARCFLPIDPEDKVDIEGQNFHKMCSMCCICRTIPTSIKMFYGHVFCNECFKANVLNRFRGEPARMHSNSWWMQWAPGAKPQDGKPESTEKDVETDGAEKETETDSSASKCTEEGCKKCICARCLQAVDASEKVDIGGQSFHPQCAKCYFCHTIPTDNVKIYYGQVFCEECFQKYVMARNRDSPQEHFRACFEHWQNNEQFAENMREFMSGGAEASPLVFMMQGAHPPFCRCGAHHARDWCQNEPRKSATPATLSVGGSSFGTWDLSFENRTEGSDLPESRSRESANQEKTIFAVAAAEKIEKLTKYLQDATNSDSEKCSKKWKNFFECDKSSISEADQCVGWINLQNPKVVNDIGCPKCLWQCGPIFVNGEHFQKFVC